MNGHPRRLPGRPSLGSLSAAAIVLHAASAASFGAGTKDSLQFAADMAERGNWREARYRWEQLLAAAPREAKIYNNLAVAAEAAGDVKLARQNYSQALGLAGGDPAIQDNFRRFERLSELLTRSADGESAADAAPAGSGETAPPEWTEGEDAKVKGKTQRVDVVVPVPPRIDTEGIDTLLVASFRTDESALLDVNSELARFLRGEFRRRTRLEVLDVVPPPAIPEQRTEDLIANDEFWKHLGKEHDAHLIVSGVAEFGRQEVSGFEEVDVISPATGQKVRETRFVEQEEFSYALDLLYMDGRSGELLFRDRLRKAVRFRGLMNDPLHAFYELGESLSEDIVSVVSTRMRVESRTIYKR
jgi:hypothetical protein